MAELDRDTSPPFKWLAAALSKIKNCFRWVKDRTILYGYLKSFLSLVFKFIIFFAFFIFAIITIPNILLKSIHSSKKILALLYQYKTEDKSYIRVDTPKLYTRERLVNDRYQQQAWLSEQLDKTNKLLDEKEFSRPEAVLWTKNTSTVQSQLMVGSKEKNKSDDGTLAKSALPIPTSDTLPQQAPLTSAPISQFRDALAYRDVIRSEMLSTQLDDRHDIAGNTLYRLNFDVSILPKQNVKDAVYINIIVQEDDRPEVRAYYKALYLDWQKEMQRVIDNAVVSQTSNIGIDSGEFFDTTENLALLEFFQKEICSVLKKINRYVRGRDSLENSSCDNNTYISVQDMSKWYVDTYMNVLEFSIKNIWLMNFYKAQSKMEKAKDIPTEFQHIQHIASDIRYADRVEKELDKAFDYARKRCENEKGEFFTEGSIRFPCPNYLLSQEPLRGSFVMLKSLDDLLKYLDKYVPNGNFKAKPDAPITEDMVTELIKCLIDPYKTPEAIFDNTKERGSNNRVQKNRDPKSCLKLFTEESIPEEIYSPPSLEKERKNRVFMRQVIAMFFEKKLNNELKAWTVDEPLKTFFQLSERGGCEIQACTLLIKPRLLLGGSDNSDLVTSLRTILNQNAQIYSYGITPTETVQQLSSQTSLQENLEAALQMANEKGAKTMNSILSSLQNLNSEVGIRHRSPLVVGFGTSPYKKSSTEFGWLILPHLVPLPETGDTNYLQIPHYYQLSAVLSVPSWWKSLKIHVKKNWFAIDGTKVQPEQSLCDASDPSQCDTHFIEVPGSPRDIAVKLRYEVRQEPYIDAISGVERGEPLASLEIGRSGRLILEGGRLWRGAKVAVGTQEAKAISVLPNMKGIVAEFDCVHPLPGTASYTPPKQVPVFVWTSEGRTRAPFYVYLKAFTPRPYDKNDRPCLNSLPASP